MRKNLIQSLRKIISVVDKPVGQNFLKSGNILNKLKELDIEDALDLADVQYKRTAKEKESSEVGYLLGRLNRTRKPVYRIEIPPYVLFLIGTEADVLRKIAKFKETEMENKDEKKDFDKKTDEDIVTDLLEEDIK